jgi:glutamine amidotransferase
VLGHNGILFQPSDQSFKSDTRIFAEAMLPGFGSLDSKRKFAKLEKFCTGNKLLVLTVNPKYRQNAYLINGHLGNWVDGAWHSNFGWEPWQQYVKQFQSSQYGPYAKHAANATIAGVEPWPCALCGARDSVSTYTLICDICDSCNDCEMERSACMCYYSGRSHRDDWEESSAVPARTDYKDWRMHRAPVDDFVPASPGSILPEQERLALTTGTGWSHNS